MFTAWMKALTEIGSIRSPSGRQKGLRALIATQARSPTHSRAARLAKDGTAAARLERAYTGRDLSAIRADYPVSLAQRIDLRQTAMRQHLRAHHSTSEGGASMVERIVAAGAWQIEATQRDWRGSC
jgi:hypothetical protein